MSSFSDPLIPLTSVYQKLDSPSFLDEIPPGANYAIVNISGRLTVDKLPMYSYAGVFQEDRGAVVPANVVNSGDFVCNLILPNRAIIEAFYTRSRGITDLIDMTTDYFLKTN